MHPILQCGTSQGVCVTTVYNVSSGTPSGESEPMDQGHQLEQRAVSQECRPPSLHAKVLAESLVLLCPAEMLSRIQIS
eukprot:3545570-Amphidinium_carterae.1